MKYLYNKLSFVILSLLLFTVIDVNGQQRVVTGTVLDAMGAVVGGSVVIEDTSRGVVTDVNGKYSISVDGDNAILIFSYLGSKDQKIKVGTKSVIDVKLVADQTMIEELVVVGYGVQKKSHLTGSITKFDPSGIANVPTSDITTALQGRLSGVSIQNTTSEVGVAPQISVRGGNTINTGGSPLIVVDNFVMEDGLSMVNSSDIASIEVLKDAASAAIYGSRAANGVIMITTKQGAQMKPRYGISVYTGFKRASELNPMMSSRSYTDILLKEKALGSTNAISNNDLAAAWLEDELGGSDWQRLGLQDNPMTQSVQFNVSGGHSNLKYAISGGYLQEDGLVLKNSVNKVNFRSRLDVELSKFVDLGTSISAVYTATERPSNNFVDFMRFPQWIPVRHNDFTSNLTGRPVGSYAQPAHFNTGTAIYPVGEIDPVTGEPTLVKANPYNTQNNTPLSVLDKTSKTYDTYQVSGNIYLNIKILPNLIFRTANSATLRYGTCDTFKSKDAARPGNPAVGTFAGTLRSNLTTDNTLSYTETWGDHDLNVMGGVSAEQWKSKVTKLAGTGYPNDYISWLIAASQYSSMDANGKKISGVEVEPDENLFSYFGRLNYSFMDRYLLSAVFRADGYSLFGANNKWGYFPSVSLGWRVSEESFLKDNEVVSSLKLRGSYGLTGDNNLSPFATVDLLSSALYPFGGGTGEAIPGLANTSSLIGNPDLGWAKISELDLGFDIGLLDNKINLVFDYYYSITKDMLFLRPASSITGHSQYWTNQGRVRNAGIELSLETFNIYKDDFKWTTSVNFAMDDNRLLGLGGEAQIIKEGYSRERYASIVGEQAIQFYGYKTDGIWLTQAQLDSEPKFTTNVDRVGGLKVVDTNKDGIINESDMTTLGDPYHDFTWGMTNTFYYKGFDLSFLFQGAQGGEVVNADGTYKDMQTRNANYNIENRWVSEAHQGDGQTPTIYGVSWILTDYLIEDASYVALRNVTLGYTLPKKVVKKLHLDGLRVYVTGNNLLFFTASEYRGINPEYRNTSAPYDDPLMSGYQRGAFPMATTVTAGIDIKF